MLNERIRKLRLAKGMTLQQVGDVFGISAASVSSWEKGINFPDGRKLKKLAETLGVSVNELVNPGIVNANDSGSNVPFIDWGALSKWPDISESAANAAKLLHHAPGNTIFATRYPGNESTQTATQLPLPGSIIFVDTSIALNIGNVAVVLVDDRAQLANCTRSEKGSKKLVIFNLLKEYSLDSNLKYIGTAIEWQISGKFN